MSNEYIINIGEKINRLRNLRGMSIRELAEKSDVSAGFISQIERKAIKHVTQKSITFCLIYKYILHITIQVM